MLYETQYVPFSDNATALQRALPNWVLIHCWTTFRSPESSGCRALFAQRNKENARAYLRGGKDIYLPGSRNSPDFDTLRALLARCRQANMQLHLIIYPYAHTLELFRAVGLWNAFEDRKRKVTQVADEEAVASGSAQSFPLRDFSGYSPATIEDVPAPGDLQSEMRWYWEAGHFKKELGDLVLDQVSGHHDPRRIIRHGFGTLRTAANVEAHLTHRGAERECYNEPSERTGLYTLATSRLRAISMAASSASTPITFPNAASDSKLPPVRSPHQEYEGSEAAVATI